MFHVDESFDTSYHIHSGLLLDARDAAAASSQLDRIVQDGYDAGVCRWDAELHAYEMIDARSGWRGSFADRLQVFRRALQALETNNIEVIAHGANLAAMRKRYGPSFDPYLWEFSNLLERLNERLKARDEYAVVIADDHAVHRDWLQHEVVRSREVGTGGYRNQKLTRIVDTAHFVDSKLSRMTQLADLVAYVIRRRASIPRERDVRAEAVAAEFFELVIDAIPEPKGQYRTVRG